MYHLRKTKRSYDAMNKDDARIGGCAFCRKESGIDRAISSDKYSYVIPNRTKYDVFETRAVTEHYMIIPRRHVETLADLTKDEQHSIMKIAGEYEKKGFNVYARGVGSISRSIKHQHTHLIKITNKRSKFYLFIQKPYLVLFK